MAGRPDEFSLIERYFAPLAMPGAFGLKDDAAVIDVPKGRQLVVTTDAVAEGVHFLKETDPALIARKAIRVNLSDLAAKGATPFAISVALGLPENWNRPWIAAFARGLKVDCEAFGIGLSGGDTFRAAGPATVTVTALGHVARGRYASRLGARPGDVLYVTGTIGDSVLGLGISATSGSVPARGKAAVKAARQLVERYNLPRPRLEMAEAISRFATSAMDISDGLVGDLEKLCRASDVAIDVPVTVIPFSGQALEVLGERGLRQSVARLITGGDDYELLVSLPEPVAGRFERDCAQLPFPVTRLSVFRDGTGSSGHRVRIMTETGESMAFSTRSYTHFGEQP